MSIPHKEFEDWVITDDQEQVKEPSMFKVLLHNDDYTTMEFVIMILEVIFHKNSTDATKIMLNVHQEGMGVAGIYPRDVADTKVLIVHDLARKNEYPLKCSVEHL